MKYDFANSINFVLDAIEDVMSSINGHDRNWWDKHVFYSGKSHNLPGYPYMSYNIPNPHHMEQRTADYTYDQFTTTINCNIYDKDSPLFPVSVSNKLHFILRDDYYQDLFNSNGIAIASIASNGDSSNDIANVNDIYAQNVQIKIRFTIYHRNNLPNINKVNLDS